MPPYRVISFFTRYPAIFCVPFFIPLSFHSASIHALVPSMLPALFYPAFPRFPATQFFTHSPAFFLIASIFAHAVLYLALPRFLLLRLFTHCPAIFLIASICAHAVLYLVLPRFLPPRAERFSGGSSNNSAARPSRDRPALRARRRSPKNNFLFRVSD